MDRQFVKFVVVDGVPITIPKLDREPRTCKNPSLDSRV